MENKIDLKSLSYENLCDYVCDALHEKKFHAKQIYQWLYKGVTSFEEMTNLSKELRGKLLENCFINKLEIVQKFVSKIDGTTKYLFKLADGNIIESVVMKYKHGNSICISSQVGCNMGCKFCASTLGGLIRNLTPSEMCDQIIFAEKDFGEKINHVVLMGIGEPLNNFDNLIIFLNNINNENALNISLRSVSVSTCGIVDKIDKLAKYNFGLTLSISLHCANDKIRSSLMPVNKKWNIFELMAACKRYFNITGRRISFEYTLISGVNDSESDALELAALLKNFICHVNLIPVNDVKERGFKKSNTENIKRFIKILESNNINATIRRTLGSDINASCGQLRNKYEKTLENIK